MIKRTVVNKMASDTNIDVKVTPDEAIPSTGGSDGVSVKSVTPDSGLKNPEYVGKPLTNRSMMEAAANPVIQVPPIVDKNERAQAAPNKQEEDDFMRTATKTDLDKIRALTEADILSDAVVALDLALPNFLDVRPKDPMWVLRWVNRKYDGQSGGGNRYYEMCGMGFVNATPEDIAGTYSEQINYQDGALIYQDVICMKINKARLFGIYKANLLKANRMHSRENVHKEALAAGREEMRKQLNATGVKQSVYQGKLGMFIPDKIPGQID